MQFDHEVMPSPTARYAWRGIMLRRLNAVSTIENDVDMEPNFEVLLSSQKVPYIPLSSCTDTESRIKQKRVLDIHCKAQRDSAGVIRLQDMLGVS